MKKIILPLFLCLFVTIWSGDQHLQTSADPQTGILTLNLSNEKQVKVNLENLKVTYYKYPNGQLKFLAFPATKNYYEIYFYLQKNFKKEKILLNKDFQMQNSILLLHGPSEQFDINGNILSITEWKKGKLNGKQAFYNSTTGILLEKRYFSNNFPVKTWTTYYPNESPSAQLSFPLNEKEWENTEIIAPYQKEKTMLTLLNANYPHPFTTKLTWYYTNGEKLKEIEYQFNKNGSQIMAIQTGKIYYYNKKGKTIGMQNTPEGNGNVIIKIPSLGMIYHTETTWFNHKVFKKTTHSQPQKTSDY